MNQERDSELQELRDALKKVVGRNRQFELILDALPAMVFVKDVKGRFLKVNRALAEATGVPAEEWMGNTVFDLMPEERALEYDKDDKAVLDKQRPRRFIIEPFPGSNDKERWAQTHKIPWFDDEGSVAGLIGLSVDVTQLVETERALKESEERYRRLFEIAPVSLVVVRDQSIVDINASAISLFRGSRTSEFVGRNYHEMLHPDFQSQVEEGWRRTFLYGQTATVNNQLLVRRDGSVFKADLRGIPMIEKGETRALITIVPVD